MHLLKKEDINILLLSLKVLFLPTCPGSILIYIYVKRINRRKQKDVLPQQLSKRFGYYRKKDILYRLIASAVLRRQHDFKSKIRSIQTDSPVKN